jgi:hypothetical protein
VFIVDSDHGSTAAGSFFWIFDGLGYKNKQLLIHQNDKCQATLNEKKTRLNNEQW